MLNSLDTMNNAKMEQMDAINGYLAFRKVDNDLCLKIRKYYNYLVSHRVAFRSDCILNGFLLQWSSGQSQHQKNLFEELPGRLSVELTVMLKEELVLGVPIFRGLSGATLFGIIKALESHLILPDTVLMKEGQTGDSMYLVYRGRLGVFVKDLTAARSAESPHGKQIATLRNGGSFGEMAMFGDKRRAATIQSFV